MNKLLVIELDGVSDIYSESKNFGWDPIFIKTKNYDKWLPLGEDLSKYKILDIPTLSFYDIIRYSQENEVDSILPISLLEPECLRDAYTLDYIKSFNLPLNIVSNSISTVELTYDKWLTKELVTKNNFPCIKGILIQSNNHLIEVCNNWGFPVIIKHRKNFTGQGIRIIKDIESLNNIVNRSNISDWIAEPFITGSEISQEIIIWKEKIVFQPLVYKGETRHNLFEHPAYRPRVSFEKNNSELEIKIREISTNIIKLFNLKGAIEIEFIINNGKPLLLEINPRISGVTKLCKAVSGVDTYKLLTQIAINDSISDINVTSQKFVIQFPLTILPGEELLQKFKKNQDLLYIKPITWIPLLEIKSNILLSYETLEDLYQGINIYKKYSNDYYYNEAIINIENFLKL